MNSFGNDVCVTAYRKTARICAVAVVAIGVTAIAIAVAGSIALGDPAPLGFITGTVRDEQTELPIANAMVNLKNAPAGDPLTAPAMTNASGQYTFNNVVKGVYVVVASKAGYTVNSNSVSIDTSQAQSGADVSLMPAVTIHSPPSDDPRGMTYSFYNNSPRDVTLLVWVYGCRNVNRCNPANTQTAPADVQSFRVIPLGPGSSRRYRIDRVSGAVGRGFSASLSYCYFTSVDLPGEKGSFDIVSWPVSPGTPNSCRAILSPPPSDWQ